MDPTRVDLSALPVVEIELSRLSSVYSPRTSGEDPEHVEMLLSAEWELPPILVHRSTMQVVDGLHRLTAARVRGDTKILAKFIEGTESDAFVLAVEANIRHGLPLSLADRKRAAVRIIGTHPQWSDRRVASVTGISAGTVADLRKRGGEGGNDARIGRDGRIRPVDSSERRRLAADLIRNDPGLSLRQVAKQVGISPETVRDVRGRLERGESPTPDGSRKLRTKPHSLSLTESDLGQSLDRERIVVLERLKADPALRLSEVGRILLRMLAMHSIDGQEWERILRGVPPHLYGVVAGFARDHARVWAGFADHLESRATDLAAR
ncbi:streptomycin biosynthesis protein [Amycolatopsis sp. WAC 01375]|uniref:ParB/RepB/Spo0J family partition protein n=1 Tax=Amycolatopsis sp. WAC 01375 TaxID=2203194 RepID=UPI000F76DE15|nr:MULTISPECIES: helix-turn-helix domain-containing protein [unclassified Amycolatopsis]QKN67378.1 ParB N-terminal domain-containing protein [Streptomyces coelicolor]RSM68547.1 streptomycin biosynthesis protein [Amycolatopsis sp. WAC 01375]RSN28334.1 streptomycin biosynthesis protein [Amycolatopsis sp. WAC 01416]